MTEWLETEERKESRDCDAYFVELQPGLCVALSSAQSVGAVGVPQSFAGDREFIHFNCQICGQLHMRVRDCSMSLGVGELSRGFSDGETFHIRHCEEFMSLDVMMSPQLLHVLLKESVPDVVRVGKPEFFMHAAAPSRHVSLAAMRVTRALQEDPCPRLSLHSAALDFLSWHLDGFRSRVNPVAQSLRERRQVSYARELLLHDFAAPPTISQLARKVGLNQCTLKRGFKALFGSSMYAYFQAERMRHASDLLADNSVTETASLVGYTNVSHFSSAFRRHFGVLPSVARRRQFARSAAAAPVQ